MLLGKKIIVVMPAYNAEKTLRQTYADLPKDVVDEVILVDDCSRDHTTRVSSELGIHTIKHEKNLGYGGNQKSCYKAALERNADIIVMLHPDYQYDPKLVPAMAGMIACGTYDCVLGSRILGGTALSGGMPLYKYLFNRFLTLFQNVLMNQKVSEYHTGYRAFSKQILETIALGVCDDDFIFDNQMLALIFAQNHFRVGEISCPTKYFEEASSINFSRSVKYGLGVLGVSIQYRLAKFGIKSNLFRNPEQTLATIPERGKPVL